MDNKIFNEIKLLLVNNKHDEAWELLQNINENDLGEKNYLIGIIYANKQEVENAEKYLKKAIEINNKHIGAYLSLSELYNMQEKHDSAKELLETAYRIDSSNINIISYLAGIYLLQKNYDDAITLLKQLLNDSDEIMIKKLLVKALEEKSMSKIKNNDFSDINEIADEMIDILEDYAGGYKIKGICAMNSKEYHEASEYLIKAFQKSDKDIETANLLTRALIEINDYENAKTVNDYAIKIESDNQQALSFQTLLNSNI